MLLRAMVSGLSAPVDWGGGGGGVGVASLDGCTCPPSSASPAAKRRVLKCVHVWVEGVYGECTRGAMCW